MNMIRRGTTPTLRFTTIYDETQVEDLYITFQQGSIVLEKTKNDVEWDETSIRLDLSQEETLKFKAERANVQIRLRLKDQRATATQVLSFHVTDVLKDGVI